MEANYSQALCCLSDSIKPGAFSSVTQVVLRFLAQPMIMKMVSHLLPMVMLPAFHFGEVFTVLLSI